MLEESDPDMRQMAHDEVNGWSPSITQMEEDIKVLLLPKDPLDEKDVVLEIRAGTGGDEATLFAAEVFRMYTPLRGNAAAGKWKSRRAANRRSAGSRKCSRWSAATKSTAG